MAALPESNSGPPPDSAHIHWPVGDTPAKNAAKGAAVKLFRPKLA